MVEKHWKTAGVVSLIGFLCYINSLEGDFVYDDSRAIVGNADILPSTPWSNLLFHDFWGTPLKHSGSHRSYRPVCVASFRLNYYVAGLSPWGFHLVNVLLHCGVSIMVVLVANIVFNKENIAVSVAGVLFAVHPIHTEAVSGLVGRADVGAGLFYLASWLSYHHGCSSLNRKPVTRWSCIFMSMAFAAVSMFTKEQGLTVMGVCVLYDVIIISRIRTTNFHLSLKKAKENGLMKRIVLLFTTASVLITIRMMLMNNSPPSFSNSDNPAANSEDFLTRTLTFLYLPAINFWLLVFPHTLCFDWSVTSIPLVESLSDVRNVFSFVFYASFALFVTLCLKGVFLQDTNESELVVKPISKNIKMSTKTFVVRNRKIVRKTEMNIANSRSTNSLSNDVAKTRRKIDATHTNSTKASDDIVLNAYERAILSLAFLVLPFMPATNLFFYVGFVIAERVLYIPSIGFCLLLAHGFSISWKSRGKFLRILLAAITCVYLVLLSARTVRRNVDWRSDENLYRSGIAVNPSKAWSNLGNVLKEQGKLTEAEKAYKKSIEHKWSADTWYNLGLLHQEQKRFGESVKCYEQAIELRPRFVLPYLNLGIVMENLQNKERALEILTQATQLNGEGLKNPKQHRHGVAAAKYHRGRILADVNRVDEAIAVYREAIKTRPADYRPHSLYNLLGEAHFAKRNFQKAELWYRKSLESKPDHMPAFLALARLLSRSPGRITEAEDLYQKAFKLEREDADLYIHYSKHLEQHNQMKTAAKVMREAVSKFPENFNVVALSADVHRKVKDYHLSLQFYEKAAELNPKSPSALMNLGAMYHLVMKFDMAEKFYLKTLELAPNDQSTIDNLQKLRNTIKQQENS